MRINYPENFCPECLDFTVSKRTEGETAFYSCNCGWGKTVWIYVSDRSSPMCSSPQLAQRIATALFGVGYISAAFGRSYESHPEILTIGFTILNRPMWINTSLATEAESEKLDCMTFEEAFAKDPALFKKTIEGLKKRVLECRDEMSGRVLGLSPDAIPWSLPWMTGPC